MDTQNVVVEKKDKEIERKGIGTPTRVDLNQKLKLIQAQNPEKFKFLYEVLEESYIDICKKYGIDVPEI